MNIWLIQIGEHLPLDSSTKKMRTAILADELIERGHTVTWWASAFDHSKKDWIFKTDSELKIREGLRIIALKGIGYKKNISLSRLIDHRIIAKKFKRLSKKKQRPDIIIISMPPHDLAHEAIIFGKKSGIPAIVDVRDPWPEIFLNCFPATFKKLVKVIIYKEFYMVREVMRKADSLIAPTNALLEFGLKYAGREKRKLDRVFYLGYKRRSDSHGLVSHNILELENKIKGKFVIFFVGMLSRTYHNPFIILDAAKRLADHEDIHFIISGTGELFDKLKKEALKYKNVTLTGWLNHDEIEFLLMRSKVGICPSAVETDLPTNKIFTYLSAGLPVITAFQGEMKELLKKYEIGFYYPPNDVGALTTYIDKLYQDKELYAKMSANAKKVFKEMFDADKIYAEYAEHVERVASNYQT